VVVAAARHSAHTVQPSHKALAGSVEPPRST
jgi:hypothetical protein